MNESANDHSQATHVRIEHQVGRTYTIIAFLIALLGSLGSVYLSVGMGLKACPLCFYQRSFMLATAGLLLVMLISGKIPWASGCGLALVPALAGLWIAIWHVYLEQSGALECPTGLLAIGTAPTQSLFMFAIMSAVLLANAVRGGGREIVVAVVASAVMFPACTRTNPPLPPADYSKPLDGCRKPAPLTPAK